MTDLIHRLIESDDNCFRGEYYDPTHKTDEIYTCLDCLDAGIRAAERERIIKLLEEARDKCACYREVGMPICRHQLSVDEQIALIKGEK